MISLLKVGAMFDDCNIINNDADAVSLFRLIIYHRITNSNQKNFWSLPRLNLSSIKSLRY